MNARREPDAERVTQREDLIGETLGVGVVLGDPKLELVIEQPSNTYVASRVVETIGA